jgi:hypothetical protein
MLVLGSGLLAGLGVVGACVTEVEGGALGVAQILGGVLFAAILVGAVFLFTTMSRDLRLLRQRFVNDDLTRSDAVAARSAAPAPPGQPEV